MGAGQRALAALAAVPMAAVAFAGPADADVKWTYKASGNQASVEWLEWGTLPGVGGNAHVGFLWIDASGSNAAAFGEVYDWTCPAGETPPSGGGGHGDEPPAETNCTLESERFLYGEGLAFTMDRKMASARLTGTVFVDSHDGGGGAQPAVDITLIGVGDIWSTTTYTKETDGNTTITTREKRSTRISEVDGYIGAMGFTDDPDDASGSEMTSYVIHERYVSN